MSAFAFVMNEGMAVVVNRACISATRAQKDGERKSDKNECPHGGFPLPLPEQRSRYVKLAANETAVLRRRSELDRALMSLETPP